MLYKKICEEDYYPPFFLTATSKELIKQMLQRNPLKRITLPEIKNHPWYTANLPLYLQIMDNSKSEIQERVDEEILEVISKVRFI